MLPLRDTIPSRTTPVVTYALLALNALVFVVELAHGSQLGRFLAEHGLVSVRYFWLAEARPHDLIARFGPFLTSIFLHGGWLHFLGNMLFLWIFAGSVEDRLGHVRFALLYALCGCFAGLLHVGLFPGAQIPMIGASGAIAGVLGAYLLFHPRGRVLTVVPAFLYLQVIEVPAVLFLGLWLVLQFFQGSVALTRAAGDAVTGVAWWAHLGGFAAGLLLGPLLARTRPRKRKTYPTREIFHPW